MMNKKSEKPFGNCDVLVCPSYSEGMPTVIMEGMSSGLAIISTDVGAVNQQVSNQNGWLLSEPTIDLIYASILEAIKISDELLVAKKIKSIELVQKKYIWETVIQRKIAFLKEIIATSKI